MKLHGTVGPANTTIAGIAKAAGVQRATVYRHFPDEEAIFDACTAHSTRRNPPPDPARWEEIRDPDERLRAALAAIYAFYERRGADALETQRDRDAMSLRRRAPRSSATSSSLHVGR